MNQESDLKFYTRVTAVILGAVALLAAICIGLVFLVGAVSRYQARADAKNATITAKKNVQIAIYNAQARYQASIGIRKSQDEIRKTLTPLYVSFEWTQAMQAIATSGKNNSIVYLPTNPANGLPVVPTNNSVNPTGK